MSNHLEVADLMSENAALRSRVATQGNEIESLRAQLAKAEQEYVPKEFNNANIRAAREFKARAEAAEAQLASARKALDEIDQRSDCDIAACIAQKCLSSLSSAYRKDE